MKRRFTKGILKSFGKSINIKPINYRFDLYMHPKGDVSMVKGFSKEDLDAIKLLEDTDIQASLLDNAMLEPEFDIYSLMEEGALKDRPTGADVGIYNYEPIVETEEEEFYRYANNYKGEDIKILDKYSDTNFYDTDINEYGFGYCVLAEDDCIGSQNSQLIQTFRGYLHVTMPNEEYSIIRKSQFDGSNDSIVYIPQYYVHKYMLRNGDEIVCSCKEDKGMMIMDALFTINEQFYQNWNKQRPWIKDLNICTCSHELIAGGEYTDSISKRFKLLEGDNVFVYLNKNTQKANILKPLVEELSNMFDKIIYIRPKHMVSSFLPEAYNIVKFCMLAECGLKSQQVITLLAVNYAKRLIEMGKRVAVIVDDIDSIKPLDKTHPIEMPICKAVLSIARVAGQGSATNFTIVPLRTDDITSYSMLDEFKCLESLGIVVDNNEIDLYNSYRI